VDPARYHITTFQPLVGSRFVATLSDGRTFDFELKEAREGQSNERVHQFALMFRGPAAPQLPQQIVNLSNPEVGDMDIFIVPISADASCVMYEAVFSRMIR
jgi:hypothetical protein